MWAPRGSHPERVRSTGFLCAYLLGAVNPMSGQRVGLIFPTVNTEVMNVFLHTLRAEVPASVHIVLCLDQAGWHRSQTLVIPKEMTLFFLPPYSPQLNPIERLWKYLKETYLYHRLDKTLDAILDAGCQAWQRLTEALIQSICATAWMSQIPW